MDPMRIEEKKVITKNSSQLGEARSDRSSKTDPVFKVGGGRQDPGEGCSESAGWVIRVGVLV